MTDETTPAQNLTPAAVAAAVTGTPPAANPTPAATPATTEATALDQKTYEDRIAELTKREVTMDEKLKRMETLNDKITAEGRATGGAPPTETAEETQKKTILKNFSGCIPGLDKMI